MEASKIPNENPILNLKIIYPEIREKLVLKCMEHPVRHAGYYPSLSQWKVAIDAALKELITKEFEILNTEEFDNYRDKVKKQLQQLLDEVDYDGVELSSVKLSSILDESLEPLESALQKVEVGHDILYGDIFRIIYYSIFDFLLRIETEDYDNEEDLFYLAEYTTIKKKKPETLKDIWISEIAYENLISFLLDESCSACPLLIKDKDGLLEVKPKITLKFFTGLISACIQQELIEDKKYSGDLLANIVNNTFNCKIHEKYFQKGTIAEMQHLGEKEQYYEPFMNLKTMLQDYTPPK